MCNSLATNGVSNAINIFWIKLRKIIYFFEIDHYPRQELTHSEFSNSQKRPSLNLKKTSIYGRYGETAQKSSTKTMTRASICIWFRDGFKFEPFIFLLFFLRNIDHVQISEIIPNSKRNWIWGKDNSNFEPSQYFRAQKVSYIGKKHVINCSKEK